MSRPFSNPLWDLNVTRRQLRAVLRNPGHGRFDFYFSRVLSWVPFFQVFKYYVTPSLFKKHYPRVRSEMRTDLLGESRIPFWNWVYKKL